MPALIPGLPFCFLYKLGPVRPLTQPTEGLRAHSQPGMWVECSGCITGFIFRVLDELWLAKPGASRGDQRGRRRVT